MACKECERNLPLVNKKYELCENCNSIRLTGKSLQERSQESSQKYRQKALDRFRQKVTRETNEYTLTGIRSFKTAKKIPSGYKPIKQQTSKEAGIKKLLSDLKKEIDLEEVQNNTYFCKGCGCSQVGLDKSHILSVGQYKHLELVKANMQLMCRKCHTLWESGAIEEKIALHCFIDNVMFIYHNDQEAYRKIITKVEDYRVWLIQDQDKEKIKAIEELFGILKNI